MPAVLVVVGVFVLLIPYAVTKAQTGNAAASVVVEVVCLALLAAFIAWWVQGSRRREEAKALLLEEQAVEEQRRRDLEYVQSGMAAIDQMPRIEFENFVAARLRQTGWRVSTTAATGDYGVDLIARKGNECMAIHCKRYGKTVGVSAIQQVVAGAMHHKCTSSMVVSNQEFTRAAKQLAGTHGCHLVGRSQLPEWTL
jgi:restriction system protein